MQAHIPSQSINVNAAETCEKDSIWYLRHIRQNIDTNVTYAARLIFWNFKAERINEYEEKTYNYSSDFRNHCSIVPSQ